MCACVHAHVGDGGVLLFQRCRALLEGSQCDRERNSLPTGVTGEGALSGRDSLTLQASFPPSSKPAHSMSSKMTSFVLETEFSW